MRIFIYKRQIYNNNNINSDDRLILFGKYMLGKLKLKYIFHWIKRFHITAYQISTWPGKSD